MTRRARHEDQLQRAVLDHLRWRGADGIFAFHYPAGGARSPVEAMIFKSLGVIAGIPDLLIVHQGRLFGLELKSAEGRVTDVQRATMAAMESAGAICAVAHGVDAAIAQLTQWGLIK